MRKLLQIKPAKFLLIHFALILLSILIYTIWARLVPEKTISFGFIFIVIGIVGGYLFWIYLILYGFKLIDIKNGFKSDLTKSILFLATILFCYILFVFVFVIDFADKKNYIPIMISSVISPILTISLFYILIKLTKKFKYYDKKSRPNILDYIGTAFTLCLYPFGILMIHSHLRLILRDHNVIKI